MEDRTPQTLSPRRRGQGEGGATAPDSVASARRLRREQTDPERLLWSRLRARRLGGWKFRRQFPIGRYVVDFCCLDGWLIVELDGGQHSIDRVVDRDRERTRALEGKGYFVTRFWNREVTDNLDSVCETVLAAAEGRG